MAGNGNVALPGLVVVTPGNGVMSDHARLGLPPRVDDGAVLAADVAVVPEPRLGVDGLADAAEQPERGEVVPGGKLLALLHEGPDGGRRRVQDGDLQSSTICHQRSQPGVSGAPS